jgi:hypothetical protein
MGPSARMVGLPQRLGTARPAHTDSRYPLWAWPTPSQTGAAAPVNASSLPICATLDRRPDTAISSLIPQVSCRMCCPNPPEEGASGRLARRASARAGDQGRAVWGSSERRRGRAYLPDHQAADGILMPKIELGEIAVEVVKKDIKNIHLSGKL